MNFLEKSAEIALKRCMGLKQGESCLIIYDKNKERVAKAFYVRSKKITGNVRLLEKPVGKMDSEEPPRYIAKEMLKYDVIIIVSTKSMSHTLARKRAVDSGARLASMPNITEHAMKALDIDYSKMKKLNEKIKKILKGGVELRLITEKGTDIKMKIREDVKDDGGIYNQKGRWGNLPSGEVAFAPFEGTTGGIYVVGASMSGIGLLKSPIKITVKNGKAIKIEGRKEAERLKKLIAGVKNSRNIAELGIGTNNRAKITGTVLEDEKVFGTAHIALGDNYSLGGRIQAGCHLDGVIRQPTIFIDGKKLMEKGRLLL